MHGPFTCAILSLEFCEASPDVCPGWHMNKPHGLSPHLNSQIPREMAEDFMDISYDLVPAKLPARVRNMVNQNTSAGFEEKKHGK